MADLRLTMSGPTIPSDIDVDEAKKVIKQRIGTSDNRLVMNRPQQPQMVDFAPESPEARVSEATTHFGLEFLRNLPQDQSKDNVVISPLSLQNLLNMILLGSEDSSSTQQELVKILGYVDTKLMVAPSNDSSPTSVRLQPHEAMRSVLQNIIAATHLVVNNNDNGQTPSESLMNTNPNVLNQTSPAQQQQDQKVVSQSQNPQVVAHLQTTSSKQGDLPLSGQVNFTLANLLLLDESKSTLNKEYDADLKSYYSVNIEKFDRNSSQSTNVSSSVSRPLPLHERVNKWVKNMTHNMIDQLAKEEDLAGDNLFMILLNAAHFKGRWLHTFNPKATQEQTFFNCGSDKDQAKVQYMRQKAVFGYADFGPQTFASQLLAGGSSSTASNTKQSSSDDEETLLTEDAAATGDSRPGNSRNQTNATGGGSPNLASAPTIELSKEETRRLEMTAKLNCSVLLLPFSLNDGQELSMVLLLPNKRDGLEELQSSLSAPVLGEIYKSINEQQVQVEIPKFSFDSTHDARDTLRRMGLQKIFTNQANLSRMAKIKDLKVDKIIHKAKINVDETGAEAAAASMATVMLRTHIIRPPTPVFVADHPFLFIIRHDRSNMPLFMGKVTKF